MSKYNYEFDMKYTDNPYIDIIVHSVKILGMNSVIKNESEALQYEDYRARSEFSKLEKVILGKWNYGKYGYYGIDTYFEWNSYYRMLYGLPPVYTQQEELAYINSVSPNPDNFSGYEQIGTNTFIIPELYTQYFIDMSTYKSDETDGYLELEGRYLHDLNDDEINVIDMLGILDKIKEEYTDPHYRYIYHLGDKRIDYYTARKAPNYALLYLPNLNTFDIVEQKYRRLYERNRAYTISTVYSEAYKYMSYHYDAFICILIVIQTMIDMIMEVQEYIINKDIFDSRTIRYLFESYGIEYYKEIPTSYQIRIIKNINNLLKYKSSNKNVMDILTLFDSPDIVVYTYYLMKIKKINKTDFKYYTADDINPVYGTHRMYYLGNPDDKKNNRYPIMDTISILNDNEFIQKYLLGTDSRLVKEYYNFIKTYLYISDNWFTEFEDGKQEERKSTYGTDTQKANLLYLFQKQFISVLSDKVYSGEFHDGINRYNYKKLKFFLCYILGIFDFDKYDDSLSENELKSMFYNKSYYHNTEGAADKLLFLQKPGGLVRSIDNTLYILNDDNTFSVTSNYIEFFDSYIDLLVPFIDTVILSDEMGIFSDLNSNRYVGWIDDGIIINITQDNIVLDATIDLTNDNTTAIYNRPSNNVIVTKDMIGQEQFNENYDVTFLKVPILDPNAYKCLEDMSKRVDYDTITYYYNGDNDVKSGDPFWDGISTYDLLTNDEYDILHDDKKKDVLDQDFSIERTKYIAVEAAIDVTKMSYQLSYFMNMIFDKHIDEELLTLEVDAELSSDRVRLSDLLSFTIALDYLYNGVEPDNIASDMEKNMTINGFDFDTD